MIMQTKTLLINAGHSDTDASAKRRLFGSRKPTPTATSRPTSSGAVCQKGNIDTALTLVFECAAYE